MYKSNKSADKFIEEVITPIEQNQVDHGNLYLLIEASPKIEFIDKSSVYTQFEEIETDEWSIRTGNESGNWQKIQTSSGPIEKFYKLKTLAGIIWHGQRGGNLYRAEFKGEAEKLGLHDFVYYSKPINDMQRIEIEAQEHIDRCIALGIKVKEMRLVSKVKSWTPYLAWSFSIDCAEHQCSMQKNSDSAYLDLYKKGIVFAYAHAKYLCGMGTSQMENLLQANSRDKNFFDLVLKRKNELTMEINDKLEKDFSTKYIGKAVVASLGFTHNPFGVAREARTQNGWNYAVEYRGEYEFPSYLKATGIEEEKLVRRIWYALMKQELDWQVSHLNRLIGE